MTPRRASPTINPFGIVRRALGRLWGRDVMLYTGGVSFYAMLAGAPGLAILVSIYSLVSTPELAARQAQTLALLLPDTAQSLFSDELQRLARAPPTLVGAQGLVAIVISVYAAPRFAPLPDGKVRTDWGKVADGLRARPGEWAAVGVSDTARHPMNRTWATRHGIEIATRSNGDGTWTIWMRSWSAAVLPAP